MLLATTGILKVLNLGFWVQKFTYQHSFYLIHFNLVKGVVVYETDIKSLKLQTSTFWLKTFNTRNIQISTKIWHSNVTVKIA